MRCSPRPEHGIPIAGDVYNGTVTMKNAVSLYCDFRKGGGRTVSSRDNPEKRQPRQGRSPRSRAQWPAWPQPTDEDFLQLARAMAPFVRFLDPGIVGAVVEDNRRFGGQWCAFLEVLGIDPGIYLWEGSPCAFPGVRRYAGSTEIAVFRKRAKSSEAPPQCLSLSTTVEKCAYSLKSDVVLDNGKSFDLASPATMAGSPLLAMESPLHLGLRRVTRRAEA